MTSPEYTAAMMSPLTDKRTSPRWRHRRVESQLVPDLVRDGDGVGRFFALVHHGDGSSRPTLATPLNALDCNALSIRQLTGAAVELVPAVFAVVADARGVFALLRRQTNGASAGSRPEKRCATSL